MVYKNKAGCEIFVYEKRAAARMICIQIASLAGPDRREESIHMDSLKLSEILENGWLKKCAECNYRTIDYEKRCPNCDSKLDFIDEVGVFWEYKDEIIRIVKEHERNDRK
jgi:rubrerythrin